MDPKTGELLAAYPLDLIVGSGDAGPPGGRMIASDGALWVINGGYGTASLLKVDPASGAVQEKVTFGATFVNGYAITAGDGSVWVLQNLGANAQGTGDVVRIDPSSAKIVDQFNTESASTDIEIGAGGGWVTHQGGTVTRFDLDTTKTLDSVNVGSEADAVAIIGKTVWVADGLEGSVVAVDSERDKVTGTVVMPNGADDLVASDGELWVLDTPTGTVAVVDPEKRKVVDIIRVGSGPRGIAAGAGAIWTANGDDGSMTRIDPKSHKATTIPTGQTNGPCCITVGLGSVWVAAGTGNAT